MIIGIGDRSLIIAAVADAVTFGLVEFKNFIKVVVTGLETLTCRRFTGSELRLGMLKPAGFGVYLTVSLAWLKPFRVCA